MEEVSSLIDIKRDFEDSLEKSQMVTLDHIKSYNWFMTLSGRLLKILAPLM